MKPLSLTLTPNEVPRFLRPSGLVLLPLKEQPTREDDGSYRLHVGRSRWASNRRIERDFKDGKQIAEREFLLPLEEWLLPYCPLGSPGATWVGRETWWPLTEHPSSPDDVAFRADYIDDPHGFDGEKSPEGKYRNWKPSTQMPLHLARIRHTTTKVELRRVRTISEGEIKATGIEPDRATDHPRGVWYTAFMAEFDARYHGAFERDLWCWFCWYETTKV